MFAMGQSPLEALSYSLAMSQNAFTWLIGDRPACIAGVGVGNRLTEQPHIWVGTTDDVAKHKITFIRGSEIMLDLIRGNYARLESHVDARLVTTLKWARRLGFMIEPPVDNPETGFPVHFVYREF